MTDSAVRLLKRLIATPSFSRSEDATAELLQQTLSERGVNVCRHFNNVCALARPFDSAKPTLMLNSHHDTVGPSLAYTRNPFEPAEEGGALYGLGSNDAGASLVGLIEVFMHFKDRELPFNLLLVLTAEEEVTGEKGMRAMAELLAGRGMLPRWAIIGEPTGMDAAIGERGLVVLDAVASAKGGHAARNEGENALYKALDDIQELRRISFPKESALLGPIKVTVTQIEAGRQHNVLPEECRFVVDVRTTDALTNEETVEFIRSRISSRVTPRSTRIRASAIGAGHPLVKAAVESGAQTFVSPTTSDQSVLPMVDTLKIGIGRSERSHTADEFVFIQEIKEGIERYISIINRFAHAIMEQGL